MSGETFVPIMNRGWHSHATSHLFAQPGPAPGGDRNRGRGIADVGNRLLGLVRPLYDIQWLFYAYATAEETRLTRACGTRIVLTRESGVVGVGGEYEYVLPDIMRSRARVYETLLRVHTDEARLAAPEPDMLYLRFTGVNLYDEDSGVLDFYDPLTRTRRSLDVTGFEAYLATEFEPVMVDIRPRVLAAFTTTSRTGRPGYGQDGEVLRSYTGKVMLLASLFAGHDIPFERFFDALIRFGSFERVWQLFTAAVREGTQTSPVALLMDLYSVEALGRVQVHA